MKKIAAVLLSAAMIVPFAACSAQQQPESKKEAESSKAVETAKEAENNRETIYQVALLQSLTQGYYDGIIKVSELKQHGDTGIGTFEGVNGEMIVLLDGKVYQALGDGTVKEADDNETVPFSNVTYFDKDLSATLSQTNDINALKESLTKTVNENGRNLFYFVKINGTFKKMNVRSELKQEKPYKSLDKALATDQRPTKGSLITIISPEQS